MPMLDMQRRSQQIGRIRVGQQVRTDSGKMRPTALSTFRFTTGSQVTAEAIADLYGGTVQPWEGRRGQFEVVTSMSEIWVSVPPRDAVVSQWYEKWGRSGVERRCDSQHEQISGGPCLCPHAEDPGDAGEVREASIRRADLAKQGKACARVTRINVIIPDLPGLGVFRLDTGSFDAAGEVGDKAQMMEIARTAGVFLKAKLRIEWRERGSDRKPYPVPVLEILDTVREIVSGELAAGGIAAQLPPAPGERLAITSGPQAAVPPQGRPAAAARPPTAQEIANAAAKATTRAQIREMKAAAEEHRVERDMICPPGGEVFEELDSWLHTCWENLDPAEAGRG